VPPAATLAPVPHDKTIGVTFDNPPVVDEMIPVVLAPVCTATSGGESVHGAAACNVEFSTNADEPAMGGVLANMDCCDSGQD